MSEVVEVRLGSDALHAELIGETAARLGVDLLVLRSEGVTTTVGDVVIPSAAPSWLVEAALLRALRPTHVLFLCVANSARSQLAEGLGRALAPDGVKVSSAGSVPTAVRPEAITSLAEIGIDIGHHSSTAIDEVARPVDAVITLCAEEVCPLWLEDAWQVHWGLPDPAAVEGGEEERLASFQAVRDELRKRLKVLFGTGRGWG